MRAFFNHERHEKHEIAGTFVSFAPFVVKRRFAKFALCALALAGCFHPAPPLSPGEAPLDSVPPELREGPLIDFNSATAVILNSKGQVLLSVYLRAPGYIPPGESGTLEGGHALVTATAVEDALGATSAATGWYSVKIFQECVVAIETLSGNAFGLLRTLPWARREDGESAWQVICRVAPEQAGLSGDDLKCEYFYENPEKKAVYLRLRYTGNPADRFLIEDSAKARGESFHSECLWVDSGAPPVQMLIYLLGRIDGLNKKTLNKLFDL